MTFAVPDTPAGRTAGRYATAWLDGDLETMLACYGESFTLHYFGQSRFAGDHIGRDAALATMFEASSVATRDQLAVLDLLASADAAVLVVRERLSRDGEQHTVTRLLRYRVEDDQFVECWLYDEDQRLIDHLWRD